MQNTYTKDYIESHETELSTRQILLHYVLVNRLIWYIAFANALIYLVRYASCILALMFTAWTWKKERVSLLS